jgi:hypothetical protein
MSSMKLLIGALAASLLASSHDGRRTPMAGTPDAPATSGEALGSRTVAPATVHGKTPALVAAMQGQVIAFSSRPASVTVYPQPFTVQAHVTSGLPVRYQSITPAVCSVDGVNGTALAAGVCTIVADQAGNDSLTASPQARTTLTILKAAQNITFKPPWEVPSGASSTALEASSSSGLPVRFSSLTPEVCAIVGSSVAAVAGAGTCTIRALQEGNANFEAAQEQGTTIVCPQVVLNHHAPTRWTGNFRAAYGGARYATIHFSTQQIVAAFFGSDDDDDLGVHLDVTTSGNVGGCSGTVELVLTLRRDGTNRPTVLRLTGLVDPQSERQPISGSYVSNEISPSTGLEETGDFVMTRE